MSYEGYLDNYRKNGGVKMCPKCQHEESAHHAMTDEGEASRWVRVPCLECGCEAGDSQSPADGS